MRSARSLPQSSNARAVCLAADVRPVEDAQVESIDCAPVHTQLHNLSDGRPPRRSRPASRYLDSQRCRGIHGKRSRGVGDTSGVGSRWQVTARGSDSVLGAPAADLLEAPVGDPLAVASDVVDPTRDFEGYGERGAEAARREPAYAGAGWRVVYLNLDPETLNLDGRKPSKINLR